MPGPWRLSGPSLIPWQVKLIAHDDALPIERNNLTARTHMKRLNRLTICFSKKLENLAAATALWVANYNFVWKPSTLKGRTPAMAAGFARHNWKFENLCDEVTARYF